MSKFKAVLFDLDGTLVDSLGDLTMCANKVLEQNQFPTHDANTIKGFVGEGVRLLVKRFLPESHRDDPTVDKILTQFRDCYSENYANKTCPYPGIAQMLDAVTELNIKMAVFSNKPQDLTIGCVEALLPDWTFDALLGSTDELPRKPDPAGALYLAEKLNVAPQECLFLGDSGTDMKTAVSAGMYPVGALWGYRSEDILAGSGAKAMIEKPQKLLSIL